MTEYKLKERKGIVIGSNVLIRFKVLFKMVLYEKILIQVRRIHSRMSESS